MLVYRLRSSVGQPIINQLSNLSIIPFCPIPHFRNLFIYESYSERAILSFHPVLQIKFKNSHARFLNQAIETKRLKSAWLLGH